MFDKDTLKNSLSTDDVYRLVDALGGEPRTQSFGLICATICHNAPGEGSHKLYYYDNTKLFRCYTDCSDTFDIYELVMRALNQQKGIELKLYQSFTFVANFFGYSYTQEKEEKNNSKDKEIFERYKAAQPILPSQKIDLPIYNPKVLKSLVYPRIIPWEKDGIAPKIIKEAKIGYYPVGEQITIPHFDKDGRFVGLRGRALITTEADNYGKYRPIKIDNILYTHPLGLNLYNLNHSKDNIAQFKKAIVFESEKSTLLYRTYFDYDISFSLPVRCKWDLWMPSLKWGGDIKSTTATTQKQFEEAARFFDYDRQRYFYMNIAGSTQDILIGISKVNYRVFKVPIKRGDCFWKSGEEKCLCLAFKYWEMFGDLNLKP